MASSHFERLSSSTLQSFLLASLFPYNGFSYCITMSLFYQTPAVTQYAPLCHLMCHTKRLCGCVVRDILNSVDICMLSVDMHRSPPLPGDSSLLDNTTLQLTTGQQKCLNLCFPKACFASLVVTRTISQSHHIL